MNDYPMTPGHRGVKTSIAAAQAFLPVHFTQQQMVYGVVEAAGPVGAIGDEIAETLGWSKYEVRPRTSELRRDGRIVDSGKRRKGVSGRNAIVWITLQFAVQMNEQNPPQTSEALHIAEECSASPPVAGPKRAAPSLQKGGRRRA